MRTVCRPHSGVMICDDCMQLLSFAQALGRMSYAPFRGLSGRRARAPVPGGSPWRIFTGSFDVATRKHLTSSI